MYETLLAHVTTCKDCSGTESMESIQQELAAQGMRQGDVFHAKSRDSFRHSRRWAKIPLSAPPQINRHQKNYNMSRTTTTTKIRAVSAYDTQSLEPQRIRVDDVYMLAELVRMRSSMESRRNVLEKAQRLLRHGFEVPRSVSSTSYNSIQERQEDSQPRRENTNPNHGFLNRVEISFKGRALSSHTCHTLSPRNSPPFRYAQQTQSPAISRTPSLGNPHPQKVFSSALHTPPSANSREPSPNTLPATLTDLYSPIPDCCHDDSESDQRPSVSRQCCEIIGPCVCRECQELDSRARDREKTEADFPRNQVNEQSVTTLARVQRIFPNMTQAEVEDKVARGEMIRSSLLFPRQHDVETDDNEVFSDDKRDNERLKIPNEEETDSKFDTVNKGCSEALFDNENRNAGELSSPSDLTTKDNLKLVQEPSTPLFFMDLRHMNSKIYNGRSSKSLKTQKKPDRNKNDYLPSYNKLFPAFVSPRKFEVIKEPSSNVNTSPPLMAKDKQKSNPSFFAGSDVSYLLPERLPDDLIFCDVKTTITDPQVFGSES